MISLFVQNGIAYVWSSDDWYNLRTKFRICGSLIGSLPSFPRQNDFLAGRTLSFIKYFVLFLGCIALKILDSAKMGLPMALMSEEAVLLVEKGVCELFEISNITDKPSDSEKEHFGALTKNILDEQTEALRKRKIEQLSQKIDIIIAGKRQKLLSKGISDVNLDKKVLLQEEINRLPALAPGHVLVQLPREHFLNTEKKKVSIDILRPSVSEGDGVIRYAVFRNLWERGFYITSGSKFGSDYLLYPGDPVRFHATYMVRCICDQTTVFHPSTLVAFGRLAVAVNKLAVLAFCNSYGHIEYQTLQWHDSVNG